MRVVQIADTHISSNHRYFQANNERIAARAAALKPDLIIQPGDVSMDGAGDRRDLELARRWIEELAVEALAVPGNREVQVAGVSHLWSPAASFVCGSSQQDLGGERRLGLIEHSFGDDGVTSRFVCAAGPEDLLIEPVQHLVYPPSSTANGQ